jgi:hypothetical protein
MVVPTTRAARITGRTARHGHAGAALRRGTTLRATSTPAPDHRATTTAAASASASARAAALFEALLAGEWRGSRDGAEGLTEVSG